MRRCLTGSLKTIMATRTATADRRVVHESDCRPARSNMAVRTLAARCDVICRFRRGAHHAALGMTTQAGGTCGRKCAVYVTAFTGDIAMRAIEYEAGTEMIEV